MSRHGPRYSEAQAREAIAPSMSYSEALRRLGMRPAGGNHRTIRRYAEEVGIPVDHFDAGLARRRPLRREPVRLDAVLVAGSTYHRALLKERLFAARLKERSCELCGQGEIWRGRRMALILDHVNGVADDNRLENLRVVCPNCNATLDTHCGRNSSCRRSSARAHGVGRRSGLGPRVSGTAVAPAGSAPRGLVGLGPSLGVSSVRRTSSSSPRSPSSAISASAAATA